MPSLALLVLGAGWLLGARGHEDGLLLLQLAGAGEAPSGDVYRLPKEWRIITDRNASADDFKMHDSLRALLSTDKAKSTSDNFPMGSMLSPTQIQALVTVTMLGCRYADEGITRLIEEQEKWNDGITNRLVNCTNLVNQINDTGLEAKDVSLISEKTMRQIDHITHCAKNFANFAYAVFPRLFEVQTEENGRMYNFTTVGEGRMIPGIDGFAERVWSPEATRTQQSDLITPLSNVLALLKNETAKTKQEKISVLYQINSELVATVGVLEATTRPFREVQRNHEEFKFIDDLRASPIGMFAPQQLLDVLRTVVSKFHTSANMSIVVQDRAQDFTDALVSKNIIAVGAAATRRAVVLGTVLAVFVALFSW